MLPKSSANISMRLPRKFHNGTEKVVVDFTNKNKDLPLNPSQSHLRPQQSIPLLQAPDVSPLD
jgi:hypothetical protein